MRISSFFVLLRGQLISNCRRYSFDVQWDKSLGHLTCFKHIFHHVYSSTPLETSRKLLPSLLTSGASWICSASPLCCQLLNFQSLPSFTQDFGNLGYTVPLAFVLGDVSI